VFCTTVSFPAERQTIAYYPERRSAIREGRHRTPDRQQPIHVPRSEIEALGAEIGLEDPAEAARLFDRLKGVSWRGDYVRSDEGWVAAWIRDVN
jgi:hypothetical protein